jgi:polysaccharide export outer membrane protein
MRIATTWHTRFAVLLLGWLVLGLAPLAAWSQAATSAAATIQPDDVLKISVYGNPDLSTTTRVMQNGTITFPLIGAVPVGGVTPAEAESRIAARLGRGGFVRNAAVSVFVDQRSAVMTRSATLLGQVGQSGQYSIDPSTPDGVTSLVALLAKAGGPTESAANYCYLIRKENGQPKRIQVDLVDLLQKGNIKADVPLNHGDIVLVPQMDVFYVYGEVQKPGQYKLERDMTIMQGLSVASGLTPRGNVKGIVLNRKENGIIASHSSELTDRLQPNDVVYVKTAVF